MNIFSYKEIYIEDNKKVLEMNILPDKYCNFDCIFCPIGRSNMKTDTARAFEGTKDSIRNFEHMLDQSDVDLVFINSKGEALVNDKICEIIEIIKNKGKSVRLLSNGYLLGKHEHGLIAKMCDEVIGEIKVITEADFQKVQRPITGYTLEAYIEGMTKFNQQYEGIFILEVTIIKGYNDSDESLGKIKDIICKIAPDRVIVERITDDKFKKKLAISDERYNYISQMLTQ